MLLLLVFSIVSVICDSTIDLLQCQYLHEANLWFLVLGLVIYYWCYCLAFEQPKLYTNKFPFLVPFCSAQHFCLTFVSHLVIQFLVFYLGFTDIAVVCIFFSVLKLVYLVQSVYHNEYNELFHNNYDQSSCCNIYLIICCDTFHFIFYILYIH